MNSGSSSIRLFACTSLLWFLSLNDWCRGVARFFFLSIDLHRGHPREWDATASQGVRLLGENQPSSGYTLPCEFTVHLFVCLFFSPLSVSILFLIFLGTRFGSFVFHKRLCLVYSLAFYLFSPSLSLSFSGKGRCHIMGPFFCFC